MTDFGALRRIIFENCVERHLILGTPTHEKRLAEQPSHQLLEAGYIPSLVPEFIG